MTTYKLEMRDEIERETISIKATSIEEATSLADAATTEWIERGEWGDDGAWVSAWWTLFDDGDEVADGSVWVKMPIDEDALIPVTPCGGIVDDHHWTSDGCGGCDDNPGVWSTGGTSMRCQTRCSCCGLIRIEHTTGSQRNPGEHDTVEFVYDDDDDDDEDAVASDDAEDERWASLVISACHRLRGQLATLEEIVDAVASEDDDDDICRV